MTKPTGRAPGRPKGAINRASRETRERAAASGLLPHEFLLAVSRGETLGGHTPTFDQRMKAATDCAPYFAPKLAAVEHTGADGGPIKFVGKLQRDAAVRAALRADT